MKIDGPLVTVVVPVYNGEKYLADTLRSVLEQSYNTLEIIIINDGSTDKTESIIKTFCQKDPRIRYFYQSNSGLSSARNTGIKMASGRLISFIDADDLWMKDKLGKQVALIENNKIEEDIGIVYCDNIFINESGEQIHDPDLFRLRPEIQGFVYEKLILANLVCGSGSAVLLPKKIFDSVGNFDALLPTCEDWDMWLRIAKKYQLKYVYEPLVKIRVHHGQMQSSSDRMFYGRIALLSKHLNIEPTESRFINELKSILKKSLTTNRLRLIRKSTNPYIRDMLAKAPFSSNIFLIKCLINSYIGAIPRKMALRRKATITKK